MTSARPMSAWCAARTRSARPWRRDYSGADRRGRYRRGPTAHCRAAGWAGPSAACDRHDASLRVAEAAALGASHRSAITAEKSPPLALIWPICLTRVAPGLQFSVPRLDVLRRASSAVLRAVEKGMRLPARLELGDHAVESRPAGLIEHESVDFSPWAREVHRLATPSSLRTTARRTAQLRDHPLHPAVGRRRAAVRPTACMIEPGRVEARWRRPTCTRLAQAPGSSRRRCCC